MSSPLAWPRPCQRHCSVGRLTETLPLEEALGLCLRTEPSLAGQEAVLGRGGAVNGGGTVGRSSAAAAVTALNTPRGLACLLADSCAA